MKMKKKDNNLEIITRGLFKLNPAKDYVLITENKIEKGKLRIDGTSIYVELDEADKNGEVEFVFENGNELNEWLEENNLILTSDSVRWILYNPNPTTDKANDCSIRAYCAAEDLEWDDAYDTACQYGKSNNLMPNDNANCKNILEAEYGYTFVKLSKEEKGITVKEFAIKHSEGTYVLSVPSHLVTVINGEYYDTWDSGDKKVKAYYKKESVE